MSLKWMGNTVKTTPSVAPFSHLNTNSFNSQRQYLLCTKEPGVQKDSRWGAKFLLDFLASPQASCKENISGKEWTSQQKQPADLAESSFMGLGKCVPNKMKVRFQYRTRSITKVDENKIPHCNRIWEINLNFTKVNKQSATTPECFFTVLWSKASVYSYRIDFP